MAVLDEVLKGLLRRYSERVPDVGAIVAAMQQEGMIRSAADIENDHIAFRTLGVPHLGIRSFEKIFQHYGYQKRDYYHFEAKKLDAYWYAPPMPRYPRIFVSELRVGELSEEGQGILRSYTDEVQADPVEALNLKDAAAVDTFLHSALWRLPRWEDYSRLLDESEYAAWVIYNRYYLNHFTVSVHNLPAGWNTVATFNVFLEKHGFKLNDSGGKIKVSGDGLLLQSSTVAEMVEAEFADGVRQRIAGSYVEFAERKLLPEFAGMPAEQVTNAHRREGFEAKNADRIFESTFVSQTGRG
jgi:hypothetical protein